MKRGKVLMTVLVVLAVLFASCSNGMSKDDASGAAHTEKVMVSLGVDIEGGVSQKTISDGSDLGNDFTYWYKANHNWIQDRTVHGDTGLNYIMIPNYSTGAAPKNLGYFTAGEWTFSVQVKKGNDVVYSGSTSYNIFTGHTSPVITVKPDTEGDGTLSITVKVPTTGPRAPDPENPGLAEVGEYHESLSLTATPSLQGAITLSPDRSAGDNLTTFTGSSNTVTPGAYTLILRYVDESGVITETAAKAVTVYAGATTSITGTIDGGKWHSSQITIIKPGIEDFTLDASKTTKAPINDSILFTASASSAMAAQGHTIKYEWVIDGNSVQGPSATNTYTCESGDYGMHKITCVAYDVKTEIENGNPVDKKIMAKSMSLEIEVGNKVTFTPGTNGTVNYGVNSSAGAVFAPNDIVSMSVTPAQGYHVGTLSPAGEYDDATHTATFYMPSTATNFEVTFEADAP